MDPSRAPTPLWNDAAVSGRRGNRCRLPGGELQKEEAFIDNSTAGSISDGRKRPLRGSTLVLLSIEGANKCPRQQTARSSKVDPYVELAQSSTVGEEGIGLIAMCAVVGTLVGAVLFVAVRAIRHHSVLSVSFVAKLLGALVSFDLKVSPADPHPAVSSHLQEDKSDASERECPSERKVKEISSND